MKDELCTIVKNSKNGNNDDMMKIITKFDPLVKKYSRKLNYDGADSDLIICLIKTIKSFPDSIRNENEIVSYIAVSVKNEYIRLSKKYTKISSMEVPLLETTLTSLTDEDMETYAFINDLLNNLSLLQKEVLQEIFIKDQSEADIAKKHNISRQAVNRIKNRALQSLKKHLA